MKYTSIQNMNEFTNCLTKFYPPDIKRIMEIECEVTEKIHGENFRVGKTADNRYFIGQKNGMFFNFEEHPNWERMTKNTKKQISRIHDYCKAFFNREIIFYGELCGNGLQSGFTFLFEGYEVLYMDISLDSSYISKLRTRDLIKRLHLSYVPYIGTMKLGHAIEMDVNSMPSRFCKNDYIEGIVITPLDYPEVWRLQSRLSIKIKTDKYAEQNKSKKPNVNMNKVLFQSTFSEFITYGRFENVLSHCKETEEVKYEMSDLKFLVGAMIRDVEKECNEGQELSNDDRRYLSKYIPTEYKKYLEKRNQEIIAQHIDKIESNETAGVTKKRGRKKKIDNE